MNVEFLVADFIYIHTIILNASNNQPSIQYQLCQQISVVCFNAIQNNPWAYLWLLLYKYPKCLTSIQIKIKN